jgi:hypothetical protein
MKHILFYGNCQPGAVMNTLNIDNNKYYTKYIKCWETILDEQSFLKYVLESDIIITQNINDGYRDKYYLSTSFIINNAKKTTKIILFDSCHFDFYYVDLTYKTINGQHLDKPCDYHYNSIIECYKNNISIENYLLNYVNNEKYKTNEELDDIAYKSLVELKNRYDTLKNTYNNNNNVYFITIHDFVKENYKNKLLFYSMNHPTKYLLQYISENIINILQIENSINYNIDSLDSTKCILYKCIQKNVNFNIYENNPNMFDEKCIYKIAKKYYDAYSKIDKLLL